MAASKVWLSFAPFKVKFHAWLASGLAAPSRAPNPRVVPVVLGGGRDSGPSLRQVRACESHLDRCVLTSRFQHPPSRALEHYCLVVDGRGSYPACSTKEGDQLYHHANPAIHLA
jgi:hypothetical protein